MYFSLFPFVKYRKRGPLPDRSVLMRVGFKCRNRECHKRNCSQTVRHFLYVCMAKLWNHYSGDQFRADTNVGHIYGRVRWFSSPVALLIWLISSAYTLSVLLLIVGEIQQLASFLFGLSADVEGCAKLVNLVIFQPFTSGIYLLLLN